MSISFIIRVAVCIAGCHTIFFRNYHWRGHYPAHSGFNLLLSNHWHNYS